MSQPEKTKIPKSSGSYTGERLRTEREERIVNLLSLGEPVAAIAKLTRSSRNTVDAVRARRWSDIEQRKTLIRDSAARLAVKGFDRLNEEMDAGKIKGSLLVPVTGMAVDKLQILSGDPMLTIRHEHAHIHVDAMADFNATLAQLPDDSPAAAVAQTLQGLETVETALTLETDLNQQTPQKGKIEARRYA